MNLFEAISILELPKDYDDLILRSNYRRLAKLYHPDKNDYNTNDKFIKLNEAFQFLQKQNFQNFQNTPYISIFNGIQGIIPDMIKIINGIKKKDFLEVSITPKEYFTGIKFDSINLVVPPCHNLDLKINNYKVVLNDTNYSFKNGVLYFNNFNISLKESLVGFKKTFKDPLGNIHQIEVNQLVKQNDGYSIIIGISESELIILFNIIYPKKIDKKVLKELKLLEF